MKKKILKTFRNRMLIRTKQELLKKSPDTQYIKSILLCRMCFLVTILVTPNWAQSVQHESYLTRDAIVSTQKPTSEIMDKQTRFAIIGYTYGLLRDKEGRQKLIDQVNKDKVDHVFILGDADLWKSEVVDQYKQGFNAPVHFAPGNHETADDERVLEEQHEVFLANVGYDNKVIVEDDINFISVNSGQDVVQLNEFLAKTFQDIPDDRPTVMFGHHRIWDDNLISPYPNSGYKSYKFAELLPDLRQRVNLIFSGNSARIYFGHYGKSFDRYGGLEDVNDNIIYWCDIVEGVRGCSVGMKGPFQAGYVIASTLNGEVALMPRVFKVKPNPKKLANIEPVDRTGPRWVRWIAFVLGIKTVLLAMAVGFVTGVFTFYLMFKRGRRD